MTEIQENGGDDMAKKKIVESDMRFYVIFGTRRQKQLFNDKDLNKIINSNEAYFKLHKVVIYEKETLDQGSAVYFCIAMSPDMSLSNVIFNIKRNSFPILYQDKNIKEQLAGEKAIWTRDFAVSSKGKYSAIELYHKLPDINPIKSNF